MRAVVIGNGSINDYGYIKSKIRADDFIICADGGCNHAVKLGVKPDVIIGDFDSAVGYESAENVIRYPTRKDYTDGELAVEYALGRGCDGVVLLAMTGDRADHTVTDILLLAKCENGVLIDDNNEIYMLKTKVEIEGRKGDTVSIVPVNGDLEGVVTEGLEYPLRGETLYFGKSRGVSNVMTADRCAVTAENGIALVIKVRKV